MDETAKAKLRNRARILHWVTELALLVVLAFAVVASVSWPSLKKAFAEIFLNDELFNANTLVTREFGHFYSGRCEQLLAYPPPADCSQRDAWAKKITDDFRQPVAVFVRDCCGLEWISRPPELAAGQAHLERFINIGAGKKDHVSRHEVGLMEMRQISFDSDSLGFDADIVGPLKDSLRWGIVRRYKDTWRAFLISLNDPQTVIGPQHPAYLLQEVVSLPSNLIPALPKYRASIDGEVVFASPKLDTTRHKYIDKLRFLRQEFYNSNKWEGYARFITRKFVTWKAFVLPLFLMLVIHLYWLWIKKLTAPGLPN